MDKYQELEVLGDGTFGTVTKAKEIETGEIVAIKKFKKKYTSWDECKNLREVKSLVNLKHENIVKVKEMIRVDDILYLVFEFLDKNIYELMKNRQGKTLSESQIRTIMWQILRGIEHMHKYGFFHRDLKPENLLILGDRVKIADFGLAREIRSIPPYTDYVATRWYRAPECALKSTNYNSPVDIWAMGAIMAELYSFKPLFPGLNEKDLLLKMCTILGSPNSNTWPEGLQLAKKMNFSFPNFPSNNLSTVVTEASPEAITMITSMLSWDPNQRPTAQQLLQHPYFQNYTINQRIATPEVKKKINIADIRRKSRVLLESTSNNFNIQSSRKEKEILLELRKKEDSSKYLSKQVVLEIDKAPEKIDNNLEKQKIQNRKGTLDKKDNNYQINQIRIVENSPIGSKYYFNYNI